jgi:3',5'-cyclic AMP phosphodiesterase CpdA
MFRILHLSDVHFGDIDRRSAHAYTRRRRPNETDPLRLSTVLANDKVLDLGSFDSNDLIVISGDLAWSGASAEYDLALQFLNDLRAHAPRASFVLIPGNHDYDWTAPDPLRKQDGFIKLLRRFYGAQLPELYPLLPSTGSTDDLEHILYFQHIPDKLLILGLNTAFASQKGEEEVFISPSIRERVEEMIKLHAVGDDIVKILVIHHHLLPFASLDDSNEDDSNETEIKKEFAPDVGMLANSADVQSWLARLGFSLVLHGHRHQVHIRRDSSFRPIATAGMENDWNLVIVGAGSAGVHKWHTDEGWNFNLIEVLHATSRSWVFEVLTRTISTIDGVPRSQAGQRNMLAAGQERVAPASFIAERMDHCHKLIAKYHDDGATVRNFVSVVERPDYHHPDTIRLLGEPVPIASVKNAFLTLHPELRGAESPQVGWSDKHAVAEALSEVRDDFRFRHGSRMFGAFGQMGRRALEQTDVAELQPLRVALSNVRDQTSRAYVGLYQFELDALHSREAPPTLVGVQFVPDGSRLNLVMTFRKLELSFWWAVNMYEAVALLRWAVDERSNDRWTPGSITFFAALAEWNRNPSPSLTAEIDRLSEEKLMSLVVDFASGRPNATARVESLLHEKHGNSSDVNIEPRGLQLLSAAMQAVIGSEANTVGEFVPGPLFESVAATTGKAAEALHQAVTARARDRQSNQGLVVSRIRIADEHITEAITALSRSQGQPEDGAG